MDEIAEAGSDMLIKNERLQTLLYDYCVGPDIDAGQDQDSKQADITEVPTTGAVEAAVVTQSISDIVRERSQAARLRAQEIYGELLDEILGDEDIIFVDVVAKSLGANRSITHRATERRQRAINYADIDPERLRGLVLLRNQLREQEKDVSLHFIRAAQGQKFPPFVMYVRRNPSAVDGVCLMENPVVGYASRIYPVDGQLAKDWRDVITLSSQELAELDIKVLTKIHKPKGSPSFDQHYRLDLLNMINMRLASLRPQS